MKKLSIILSILFLLMLFNFAGCNTKNETAFFTNSTKITLTAPEDNSTSVATTTESLEWEDPDYDETENKEVALGDLRLAIFIFEGTTSDDKPIQNIDSTNFREDFIPVAGVYLDQDETLNNHGKYSLSKLYTYDSTTKRFTTTPFSFSSSQGYFWVVVGFTNGGFISHSSPAWFFVAE